MRIGRIVMGVLYIGAGIAHLVLTSAFASIVPDYLPRHREIVLLSGVAEIAGGLGVLLPPTRRVAAWGLVLLLVAVFPANVWMVQHPERFSEVPLWILWIRLPLQVPLIWWAWLYTQPEAPAVRAQ